MTINRMSARVAERRKLICGTSSANSPDLHPIEHLHKDQKNELEPIRFATQCAGRESVSFASSEMERVWCHSETFQQCVTTKADIRYWKGLAYRAKHSDPPYGNRFKDSL
jgi:hypothetical protein